METSNDCFIAALQKELKEQGRGAKKKLAASVDVSPNHLSDILALRKNAGQNLKERIADNLGISFEEMLVLGRRIIEGWEDEGGNNVSGSDSSKDDRGGMEQKSIRMNDLLAMAARVLESKTPYRQALISNITAYHQAMDMTDKENKALQLIKSLQEEINIMRQDIDELKRSEKDEVDSPKIAAA
ncbi:MAG: hypothetical protein WBB19_01130 [Desulforhopalus sp.]